MHHSEKLWHCVNSTLCVYHLSQKWAPWIRMMLLSCFNRAGAQVWILHCKRERNSWWQSVHYTYNLIDIRCLSWTYLNIWRDESYKPIPLRHLVRQNSRDRVFSSDKLTRWFTVGTHHNIIKMAILSDWSLARNSEWAWGWNCEYLRTRNRGQWRHRSWLLGFKTWSMYA